MLKRIVFTLYVLVIVTMAAATFIEKSRGTDFVHTAVYGSWLFTALWAFLALAALMYIVPRRERRLSTQALTHAQRPARCSRTSRRGAAGCT